MSDLLAIYIDMELKISKRTKEDQGKICTRLISCLCLYLGMYSRFILFTINIYHIVNDWVFFVEYSTEHLLDTLIKIQFMCRSYHAILNPVIT